MLLFLKIHVKCGFQLKLTKTIKRAQDWTFLYFTRFTIDTPVLKMEFPSVDRHSGFK